MVSWFCGEMFSLDISVVVFLWLHSPLDTLLFLGIFFCQKNYIRSVKDFVFWENSAKANNQWNIGADLGNDPMESAFARTLTAGIKGVAMVLDQEVQPLTSDSTNMSRRDSAAMYLYVLVCTCMYLYVLVWLVCTRMYLSFWRSFLFLGIFAQKTGTSVLRSLVSIRISPVKPWALGVGFCHQRWSNRWCCLAQAGLSQSSQSMLFSIHEPNNTFSALQEQMLLANSCPCLGVVRFYL